MSALDVSRPRIGVGDIESRRIDEVVGIALDPHERIVDHIDDDRREI